MSNTFDELGLSDEILTALTEKGFTSPTPIQASTIPLLLENNCDIIGQAQTGTGKTAAFGLPIIQNITANAGYIQALIIAPTRELAIQVCNELHSLKGSKKLSIIPIYGGQSIGKQRQQLQSAPDIVVGTPGRLIDHMKGKNLNLSDTQYVVLDEADEMLTSGFVEDIEHILSKTNPDRRTILFSATMPKPILKLAQKYMTDPQTITAKKETLATTLTEQRYFEIRESDKLEALCRIIDVEDEFYGLIFCRTKRDVDTISERLTHRGYASEAMHGDLSQPQRERVLKKFRAKICKVLVVTDVASRGLDISGLSHVINFALPQDPESYVHRVGRTGRAGQSGTAITLITPAEHYKLSRIQKAAKTDIVKSSIPTIDDTIAAKKARLKRQIQAASADTIDEEYREFAHTLLESASAEDVVAGILKLAFDADLSKDNYTDIKKGATKRGKSRTSSRPPRNRYRGKKDGGNRPKFKSSDSKKGSKKWDKPRQRDK